MNERGVMITAGSANAIRGLIRQDRAEPGNTLRYLPVVSSPFQTLSHVVTIQSATPFFTTSAGKVYRGYYHFLRYVDGASGSLQWEEQTDSILILCDNSCSLEVGVHYHGRYVGTDGIPFGSGSSGGSELPVYFVECGSSGSNGGSSGGAGGPCVRCGWLLDWPTAGSGPPCLELTFENSTGKCRCIDKNTKVYLNYDYDDELWLGGMFSTCCGCSVVTFSVGIDTTTEEVFGILNLVKRNIECDSDSQNSYRLKNPRCCEDGSILFDGANTTTKTDNCISAPFDCANHFSVRVECAPCQQGPCCCPGCEDHSSYPCVIKPGSPFAWKINPSGFTGSARIFNIPWVMIYEPSGPGSSGSSGSSGAVASGGCYYVARCGPKGGEFATVTFEWISASTGWRLTFSSANASAIYISGPGPNENGKFDCCLRTGFDVTRVSGGGPETITIKPMVISPNCADVYVIDENKTNQCNPVAIKNRRFLATTITVREECSGLGGRSILMTWDSLSGKYTGTVPNPVIPSSPVTATFDPSTCFLQITANIPGTGGLPEADSTRCPLGLHYRLCVAKIYCGGGSTNCSENPNAIEAYVVEV